MLSFQEIWEIPSHISLNISVLHSFSLLSGTPKIQMLNHLLFSDWLLRDCLVLFLSIFLFFTFNEFYGYVLIFTASTVIATILCISSNVFLIYCIFQFCTFAWLIFINSIALMIISILHFFK